MVLSPRDPRPPEAMAGARGVFRVGFWGVAALAIVALSVAWSWYGLAQFEAQQEQSKALAANSTMAGFGELVGGVPLVLAHVLGLLFLPAFGWFGWRGRGIVFGVVAVAVASLAGIGVAQLLWEGELFELGIGNDTWVP